MNVSEGAAGARLGCECGRTIGVPSLDELRGIAGVPAPRPNPVMLIEHMLAHGELPGGTICLHCDNADGKVVIVIAECEQTTSGGPGLLQWIAFIYVLGIFAVLLRVQHQLAQSTLIQK